MSERYNPPDAPYNERYTSNYDELIEYVEDLHAICRDVVLLRGQGWQKRQEMHEAISRLGVMIGLGPHPTGGREK